MPSCRARRPGRRARMTRNCLTRGEARLARVTRIVLPSVAVLSTVLRTLTLLVLLATTAGAQSRDRLYASSWALVIGVNAYQHVSPRLNYAVADAQAVAAALPAPIGPVLAAGRKGGRAIGEGSHGLFTRRCLDGLRGLADPEGRGVITVGQLAAWIEPRVVRDSGGRMTPQYGKLDGEGQFVFVIPAPPPAPPAVVPQVAAIASHGLLALYKADGGADDCIGGRHGALRNGAAFGPGRFGQAFRLDGVSGYVEVPA